MTTALKIALLTPGWPGHNTPNGIATAVYNLATGLKALGHTPIIIPQNIDGPCPPDIAVVQLPTLPWRLQDRIAAKLRDTGAFHRHVTREIAAAVDTAKAKYGLDAVMLEETNGWPGLVQRQVDVPVFVTLHGPWTILKSLASLGPAEDARRVRREQKGIKAAAGIIAPSQSALDAVEAVSSLAGLQKAVIPNSYFDDGTGPVSADLPDRKILFVGRFDHLKGADTVLAAMTKLTQSHPDARLTFVGPDRGLRQPDGTTVDMPTALAALPQDAAAAITYTGPLGRSEVAHLRRTHAIAINASRYETFSYTMLEAMAAGQAIVSTAVGGPAEVLEDEHTALMVPAADPDAMATALGRLLDDGPLTQSLGATAKQQLLREYSPEAVAEKTAAFIVDVIKTKK